jgi:ABC-type Fe3+-hydroxamate transport system substrate-binding protein
MSLDVTSFDCNNLGDNQVILSVTDASGNTATATATVTVVDNSNPEIFCPDDVTVVLQSGATTYTLPDYIGLNDVSATDNCNSVVISQSPAAGTNLSMGTYTILFEATDDSGNISNCSFVLTVDDSNNISNDVLSSLIHVYPNPADDILTVEWQELQIDGITIFDITGKKVREIVHPIAKTLQINISYWSRAVYFVKISTNKGIYTSNIIKK